MIRKYLAEDFEILQSWVISKDLLLQFAGTDFQYPLSKDALSSYQQANLDRSFYLGIDSNSIPYAFGEIILQNDNVPRLARILIGKPRNRGLGMGQLFIKDLIQKCINTYNCPAIELFVWDQNYSAIKCYSNVGFELLPEKHKTLIHEDKYYDIYKMTYNASK
jgi:RimJ/RimL family protein N-acetyltransferase